jgi:hypothetical protein
MTRDREHAAGSETDAAGATAKPALHDADRPLSAGELEGSVQRLQAEKQRLYEEIRSYPTPIAGCDQQFNDLLERQARVIAELRRVTTSANAAGTRNES